MKQLMSGIVAIVIGLLLAMVVFQEPVVPEVPIVEEINEPVEVVQWVPKSRRGSAADMFRGNQVYGD
jgi:hypothetical protein